MKNNYENATGSRIPSELAKEDMDEKNQKESELEQPTNVLEIGELKFDGHDLFTKAVEIDNQIKGGDQIDINFDFGKVRFLVDKNDFNEMSTMSYAKNNIYSVRLVDLEYDKKTSKTSMIANAIIMIPKNTNEKTRLIITFRKKDDKESE